MFGGSLVSVGRVLFNVERGDLHRDLALSERDIQQSTRRMSSDLDRMTRGAIAGSGAFHGLGRAIAYASTGFLGAAGFTALVKQSIQQASDLNEQINKAKVVFGDSRNEVLLWSGDSARAMGLARVEAVKYAAVFGNLLVPMGFARKESARLSMQLVQNASDMASFSNTPIDEALMALRSGLTGEIEPLRKFGVFLNDNRIKAEALSSGMVKASVDMGKVRDAQEGVSLAQHRYNLAVKEHGAQSAQAASALVQLHNAERRLGAELAGRVPQLTDAQKAMARYRIIVHDTADAHGDFQRTSGGLANQLRILRAQLMDTEAIAGKALLPTVLEIVKTVNEWIEVNTKNGNLQHDLNVAVNEAVGAGKLLVEVARELAPILHAAADAADAVAGALGGWDNAAKILLTGLAAKKVNELATAFTALAGTEATVGVAAANAQVATLLTRLSMLARIGTIALLIDLGVNRNDSLAVRVTSAVWNAGQWAGRNTIGRIPGTDFGVWATGDERRAATPGRPELTATQKLLSDPRVHWTFTGDGTVFAMRGESIVARYPASATGTDVEAARRRAWMSVDDQQAEATKYAKVKRQHEQAPQAVAAAEPSPPRRSVGLAALLQDGTHDYTDAKTKAQKRSYEKADALGEVPGLGSVLRAFGDITSGRVYRSRMQGGRRILVPMAPHLSDFKRVREMLQKKLRAAIARKKTIQRALARARKARHPDKDLIKHLAESLAKINQTILELRRDIGDLQQSEAEFRKEMADKRQKEAEEEERADEEALSHAAELPIEYELFLEAARATPDTADDMAALTNARDYYQGILDRGYVLDNGKQVALDNATRLDLLRRVNELNAQIAGLRPEDKIGDLTRLPSDVDYAIAQAEGTQDTGDDIAAWEAAARIYEQRLGVAPADQRADVQRALNQARARVAELKKEGQIVDDLTSRTSVDPGAQGVAYLGALRALRGDASNLVGSSLRGSTLTVNNYYPPAADDAHAWTRGLEFDLKALFS